MHKLKRYSRCFLNELSDTDGGNLGFAGRSSIAVWERIQAKNRWNTGGITCIRAQGRICQCWSTSSHPQMLTVIRQEGVSVVGIVLCGCTSSMCSLHPRTTVCSDPCWTPQALTAVAISNPIFKKRVGILQFLAGCLRTNLE